MADKLTELISLFILLRVALSVSQDTLWAYKNSVNFVGTLVFPKLVSFYPTHIAFGCLFNVDVNQVVFFIPMTLHLHTKNTCSAYNVNISYNLTILTKLTMIKLFSICTSFITFTQFISYNRKLSHLLICNLDLCFSTLILFVKIAKKASK